MEKEKIKNLKGRVEDLEKNIEEEKNKKKEKEKI